VCRRKLLTGPFWTRRTESLPHAPISCSARRKACMSTPRLETGSSLGFGAMSSGDGIAACVHCALAGASSIDEVERVTI
jgi:hypothetical protein